MAIPKKALDALNAAPAKCGRFEARPVTLGMAGVLEAIGSPLATGRDPGSLAGWTETLYAMTRPAAESKALLAGENGREAFRRAADEWADTVSMPEATELVLAVTRAAAAAAAVHADAGRDGPAPRDSRPTAAATAG